MDLDRLPPGQPLPSGLMGTPTYLLDGRVRWLGNPAADELLRVWDEHADPRDVTCSRSSGPLRLAGLAPRGLRLVRHHAVRRPRDPTYWRH